LQVIAALLESTAVGKPPGAGLGLGYVEITAGIRELHNIPARREVFPAGQYRQVDKGMTGCKNGDG